jgi:hypothetical protein
LAFNHRASHILEDALDRRLSAPRHVDIGSVGCGIFLDVVGNLVACPHFPGKASATTNELSSPLMGNNQNQVISCEVEEMRHRLRCVFCVLGDAIMVVKNTSQFFLLSLSVSRTGKTEKKTKKKALYGTRTTDFQIQFKFKKTFFKINKAKKHSLLKHI